MNKKDISDKIHEIAKILQNYSIENNISLFGGNAGISLFLSYYARFSKKEKYVEKSIRIISDIFDKVSEGIAHPTFAGGLAGIGWFLEFLQDNNFLEVDTNEAIGEIDEYLNGIMVNEMEQNKFDYLHAGGGIALYFLKRKSLPKRNQYLLEFVDLLEKSLIKEDDKNKWVSKIFVGYEKEEDVYNLSLSHGIASIISILSKIYKDGINKDKAYALLNGALNYILNNQFDTTKSLSYFPDSISLDGKKGHETRLAWCYGDLGISVALWNASKVLMDMELEQKAIEILLYSAKRRNLKENMVVDAGLCHGTAGIAHIFNRMFINTGILEFKEVTDYWFTETLKMAKFEDGLAGYKIWRTEEHGWTNDYGFIEGIAGIGLAMISYVSDIEPAWDECLLLS
jgi:lantibiotic biosynthesis protein